MKFKIFYTILIALIIFSGNAFAGNNDKIQRIYVKNGNVAIKMEKAGWVVAREKDIGAERVNRIYAVALTLLNTGLLTGYFNDTLDPNESDQEWEGITNIKEITALQGRNSTQETNYPVVTTEE